MKDRDKSPTIDGDTRISVVAAGFLAGAYALVEHAVMEPNSLGRHESVISISAAIGEMRESLKLVGPLYATKELRAWSRRFRALGLDMKPVRESDRIIEGLRANCPAAGAGGQRAVAFLAGHYMVLSDLQAAYAANRLERFDVIGKERSFAKFASTPKGGAAAKVRLRAFAAVTLNERMDVLESWIEAASASDAREVWASLHKAVRRSLVALDLSADCYGAKDLDVARQALIAIGGVVERVRAADAVLDVVSDPDMGARAAVAGVLPEDLVDLKAVLGSARSAVVSEARAVFAAPGSAERRVLVLAPVVPGFAVMVTEPTSTPAAKSPAGTKSTVLAKAAPAAKPAVRRSAASKVAPTAAPVAKPVPAIKPVPAPKAAPAAKPAPAPKPAPARRAPVRKPPADKA